MNHQDTKTPRQPASDRVDAIARKVVDADFQVHSALGPGLLESVYTDLLVESLLSRMASHGLPL